MGKQKKQNSDKPSKEYDDDLVFGRHPAIEVLESERDINKVFLQDGLTGNKMEKLYQLAKKHKVQVNLVPKAKLDQLTNNQNHQGVVVAASPVDYATIDDLFSAAEEKDEQPFFILLDGVEDPHNLGSIMRTADAVGAHGIIIPKRRAVGLTATVSKASTGAIEHVKVSRVTNLTKTIEMLKERGLWIFGTDMEGTDYRYWNVDSPIGLVIGSEGSGISRLVSESVDEMITIPMNGHVQSLNASVASSILMYEVFRKRNPLQ